MINSRIDELLLKDGEILEIPVGYSMWPMLKNRKDIIVIKKAEFPLKPNDVVLYRRSEKCVLHRFLKKKGDILVIRGDNCRKNEYDITEDRIFGMLKGFYNGDRYIDGKTNKGYKCYVWFWRFTYIPREYIVKPVYRFRFRAVRKISKIIKNK